MSGLYLHGMEMPTCCETCILDHKFFKWLECKKHVTGDMIVAGRRSPSCPLVAVPDHGDLIDRDLFDVIKYDLPNGQNAFNRGFHNGVLYVQRIAMDAPAVIPADKEGEG